MGSFVQIIYHRMHPILRYSKKKRRNPSPELCHSRSRRGRLSGNFSVHGKTRRVRQGEERVSRREKWLTASDCQESKVRDD